MLPNHTNVLFFGLRLWWLCPRPKRSAVFICVRLTASTSDPMSHTLHIRPFLGFWTCMWSIRRLNSLEGLKGQIRTLYSTSIWAFCRRSRGIRLDMDAHSHCDCLLQKKIGPLVLRAALFCLLDYSHGSSVFVSFAGFVSAVSNFLFSTSSINFSRMVKISVKVIYFPLSANLSIFLAFAFISFFTFLDMVIGVFVSAW